MRRMYSKSQLIDLIEEHSAESSVTSVNGKTGNVTLKAKDIKANNAATIQSNLERIDERIDNVDTNILREITITLNQGEDTWVLPAGITFARIKLDESLSNIDGTAQWCNIYAGGQSRNGYLKYIFEGPNPGQLTPHNYLSEGLFSAFNGYIEYDNGSIHIFDQNSVSRISSPATFTISIQYTL